MRFLHTVLGGDKPMAAAKGSAAADVRFAAMLREELAVLRPDIAVAPGATLPGLQAAGATADPPMSALCLSGGGIRSAAFALGVLQTLARFGVLGTFDYLSTVSGGGYIGSFLTAWRYHARDDTAVMAALDRSRSDSGAEPPEIIGLRTDSNYLTPKLGVLSADTWTVIALVIRNLVLNWVVFLPFFMGALLIPWFCKHTLDALKGTGGWPWLAAGTLAAAIGLGLTSYGRRRTEGKWLTDGRFVLLVLCPIVGAAMGFSAGAAAFEQPDQRWLFAGAIGTSAIGGALCYALAWLGASLRRPGGRGRSPHAPSDTPMKDLLAWIAAGAIAGVVLSEGIGIAARFDGGWLTTLGIGWTMLSMFVGELAYIGLRSYSIRGDMDREWLARAAGWLGAWTAVWSAAAAIALFGPAALNDVWRYVLGAIGGVSGVVALVLGGSAWTAATTAASVGKRLSLGEIASIAGLVFAIVLAIVVSSLDVAAGVLLLPMKPGWVPKPVCDLIGAAVLIGFSAVVSYLVNVNRFSLHAVYRNRLTRAFLGSSRLGAGARRQPDPFTGFDPDDNPYLSKMPPRPLLHVINVALNVVSTDNLAWQERKAESFTLTPLHAGNPLVGYKPAETFGGPRGGLRLGTAMAISGAAVSPNMGYHSAPLLDFLLMLFNVRLGWWLGNPAGRDSGREGPRFGLVTLLEELANLTTATGRWIYLSDGGHFDNLGLYEMVRRRCRFIVVSDAGQDAEATLADLGNAVRKVSIDFGVRIRFKTLSVAPVVRPPVTAAGAWVGEIWYPGSSEPGWLLYLRPTYNGNEAPDIRAYAQANQTFPHEATTQQWFSESQFEAYRALGAHQMELICSGGNDLTKCRPAPLDLAALRQRAEDFAAAQQSATLARSDAGN